MNIWDAVKEKNEKLVEQRQALQVQISPIPPPIPGIQLFQIPPQQLAQQITLREQTYFHRIPLSEFYCKAWETPGKAPNLAAFTDRFEKMKLMIASSIVEASKISSQQAAAALSFWLHVMAVCYLPYW